MADLVVGISDLKVSGNPADTMVTYALGSCIAVAVYDPAAKVGGLLHYMLPDSTLDAAKAKDTPAMFADTGIPLLFKSCYKMGADKKRMVVKVAGGASILDESNFFRIGQKNIMAMRKLFWSNNVLIDAEDTGKNFNRTVRIDLGTGKFYIKRAGGQMEEL
jgi:chemotaxis protein CheD